MVWRSVLSGLDSQNFFVCRRDERPYLAGSFVWLLTPWAGGLFQAPKKQAHEYNAAFEPELGWHGIFYGYPAFYDRGSVRSLHRALWGSHVKDGQVVMNNLSAHKGERVREFVESASCKLLYLPPYSPDLSLIEDAFSKIKGLLRKAERRSRQALVEATGKVLDRSALKPQKVSLSTEGTVLRINHFDPCCKIHEGEPLCASAAWNTTEHSGGLVLLTTPQRILHTRFANSSQKDPADTLAR